jgi:hypothetical protein
MTLKRTFSGHARGMKAISRRLSVATPTELRPKNNASQRDASPGACAIGRFGDLLASLAGCDSVGGSFPVVSLALNHRLIATMPSASDVQL